MLLLLFLYLFYHVQCWSRSKKWFTKIRCWTLHIRIRVLDFINIPLALSPIVLTRYDSSFNIMSKSLLPLSQVRQDKSLRFEWIHMGLEVSHWLRGRWSQAFFYWMVLFEVIIYCSLELGVQDFLRSTHWHKFEVIKDYLWGLIVDTVLTEMLFNWSNWVAL